MISLYDVSFVLSFIAVVIFSYKRIGIRRRKIKKDVNSKDNADDIVTLMPASFHYKTTPTIKSYPFKNKDYKLTMGIKNLAVQDWLLMDEQYKEKLEQKKKTIAEIKASTVFTLPFADSAVVEFYHVIINYMHKKYPMHFVLIENKGGEQGGNSEKFDSSNYIYNNIMDVKLPLSVSHLSSEEILLLLSQTIEEDFIILMKDPSKHDEIDGDEYYFKAGIFAFAAGFNPQDRFDKPLSFIHHPIPNYESKLKLSMNKFFTRLAPNQFVTRSNFSVQTHSQFFVDDSNKGHNLPEGFVQKPLDRKDLDFDNQVHYRSERQVLTKLPQTGAIVFSIRTYLTPMVTLKSESDEIRENFIGAINRFPDDIKLYKRAAEWAPAVTEYLKE